MSRTRSSRLSVSSTTRTLASTKPRSGASAGPALFAQAGFDLGPRARHLDALLADVGDPFDRDPNAVREGLARADPEGVDPPGPALQLHPLDLPDLAVLCPHLRPGQDVLLVRAEPLPLVHRYVHRP